MIETSQGHVESTGQTITPDATPREPIYRLLRGDGGELLIYVENIGNAVNLVYLSWPIPQPPGVSGESDEVTTQNPGAKPSPLQDPPVTTTVQFDPQISANDAELRQQYQLTLTVWLADRDAQLTRAHQIDGTVFTAAPPLKMTPAPQKTTPTGKSATPTETPPAVQQAAKEAKAAPAKPATETAKPKPDAAPLAKETALEAKTAGQLKAEDAKAASEQAEIKRLESEVKELEQPKKAAKK